MLHQVQVHPAKRNNSKTEVFLWYPIFCVLFSAIFLFVTNTSYAQYATPKQGEAVWSVAAIETNDGGYLLLGGALDPTGSNLVDSWVLKMDALGDIQWFDTYGGNKSEIANAVAQTDDGGYIVAGYEYSPATKLSDGWIVKLDAQGDELWQKKYGGDNQDDLFNSVQQTGDGGYVLGGSSWPTSGGKSEGWVLKTDSTGSILWQRTFGGRGDDHINVARQVPDGGYIVVGETLVLESGLKDGWVVRLNAEGNKQWEKVFGGETDDSINAVWLTDDGGYIVAGATNSFGSGGDDMWLMKLSSTGETDWQTVYGGEEDDFAYSIQQTADGGYIVAGGTTSFGSAGDSWIIKLDPSGNATWHKTFGGEFYDTATSIRETADGGYIVSGSSYSYSPDGVEQGKAFWVAKLDAKGDVVWYRTKWQA